jgi:dTDP-4-dehydrorhamnose reductase
MSSILIIGQHGQVSTYLQRAFSSEHNLDCEIVVAGRDQIDLSVPQNIKSALAAIKPSLIINPAAYTAVDLAEQESELAFLINAAAVKQIAEYCVDSNTPLIHFSTDYVFSGDANRPYTEQDPAAPNGVYGQSKLDGERAITESGAPAIILRTSWVYSNHGKNFYKTMLMLAQSRDELSVVADQIGAPTYAGSIAQACRALAMTVLQRGEITSEQRGIYHFSCQGETSWCEFAKAIFNENGLKHMTVKGISTQQYPTPAKRPAYSVLSGARLQSTFKLSLPRWQEALASCAAETQSSNA